MSLLAFLLVLAVARNGALSLSSRAGYVLNGYLDDAVGTVVGWGSVFGAGLAACALVVHVVKRQRRAIVSSIAILFGAITLLLWALFFIGMVGTKLPYSTVYSSKRNVYYVLCDALVPTDTVFEVAQRAWARRTSQANEILRMHAGPAR